MDNKRKRELKALAVKHLCSAVHEFAPREMHDACHTLLAESFISSLEDILLIAWPFKWDRVLWRVGEDWAYKQEWATRVVQVLLTRAGVPTIDDSWEMAKDITGLPE